jgi:hypothetical protein
LRPINPIAITSRLSPARLAVLAVFERDDKDNKAVPTPTKKPKANLRALLLDLRPQLWVSQSMLEGTAKRNGRVICQN